jgi:excisionase family DNA binding protein
MVKQRIAESSMEEDRFLTMEEVGNLIGLDRSTIYNWKRKGLLPYYKLGKRAVRFKLTEILQWLGTQKKDASGDDKGGGVKSR